MSLGATPRFLLFGALAFLPVATAWSAPPSVSFDVPDVLVGEATELSAPDGRPAVAVVAALRLSLNLSDGVENDLVETVITVRAPSGRLRVVDFTPKIRETTTTTGPIAIERKHETTKSLGINAAGHTGQFGFGSVSGGGNLGSKQNTSTRYELPAPVNIVTAAGTIERERGVYFKLRPTAHVKFEGQREFRITFLADADWTHDLLEVHCRSTGIDRSFVESLSEQRESGRTYFQVPLYRRDNATGRARAHDFVHHKNAFKRLAIEHRGQVRQQRYSSFAHQVGAAFSFSEPRIPKTWFAQIMTPSCDAIPSNFARHLPRNLRTGAEAYLQSKRQLLRRSSVSSRTSVARQYVDG